MRHLKTSCLCLLLAAFTLMCAPDTAFAQSDGDQFQSDQYCTYVTDYAQFCDFIIGVSSLDIDTTGSITTSALTEPVWGFLINQTECGDSGVEDCVPFEPEVSAAVQTQITEAETSGNGKTSGSATGSEEVELGLPTSGSTIQADETGYNYTEATYHYASFDPPGNEQSGDTSADVAFDGPSYLTVYGEQDGYCEGCNSTVQRIVGYQAMTSSGSDSSTIWVCEAPLVYNWSCKQANPGQLTTSCSSPYSATSGSFDDQWTLNRDGYTPAGCGFDVTDPWMWRPTSGITWTLATLSGYVDTSSIEINGTVWPSQTLQGYTICPSGTTFNPSDATVSPCN